MPIYEYECEKCGRFEERRSIKDGVRRRCPKCKGKVDQVFSPPCIQFVGKGWTPKGDSK